MKHFHCSLFFGILAASAAAFGQRQSPAPTIVSLFPNAVVAGNQGFSLRVDGTRFTQSSRVVWRPGAIGAANLTTTFVSENVLTAVVPAGLLEQAGSIPLVVTQPGDFGSTASSGEAIFTVVAGMTLPTACPLPNGIVGRPYEAQFAPSGGIPPYVWGITTGNLAPGLSFSSGTVRGTPSAPGEFSFTVRVTDSQNNSVSKPCSMRVVASSAEQSLFITQLEPPGVLAGSGSTQLRVRGDGFSNSNIVVWNVGNAGVVDLQTRWDGDPRFLMAVIPPNFVANPGTFPIAVRTVILTRQTFSNVENFVVAPPVQVTSACPLRDASLLAAYSASLAATGGFAPFTFTVPPGSLPPGISLRPGGELTGSPTEAGVYDLALTATDSRGNTATRACSLRVLGPLTASPTALTFSADAQGIPPAAQVLSVTGSASGLPFSLLAGVETGSAWLRVSTDTTRMPALVRVIAEPGSLGPGVYRGTLNITTEAATNRTVIVPVTLVLGNVRAAEITPRPLALRFATGRGSGRLPWQAIQIANPGPQAVDFTVETTALWLTASAERGLTRNNQPMMLRVRASADGMTTGTYRAFVRLTAAGRPPVSVPVTLSVGLAPETVIAAQSGITFTSVQGGPPPSPRPIHVLSNGSAGYFWEASTGTSSTRPFVTTDPSSNASRPGSPSSTDVRVNPEGFPPDLHFGDVRISSSNTENSPRLVSTVMEILPSQATPFPELSFTGLVLTAQAGSATPTAQGLLIRNIARSSIVVDYQLVGDSRIFSTTASTARTLGPGESRRIEVQASAASSGTGVYRAMLFVQTSADPQVRAVDVTLVATPASGRCTPTRLVATALTLAEGFQVTGGLPVGLDFRVTDDCGDPVNNGAFTMIPSNNSGLAFLQPGGDGRWAGTWPVLQNTASAVALNYFVEDPDRNLQTSGTLAGTIAASNVPVIAEDATLSAASGARGAPLAPGSLFAIYGAQLAQGQNQARSLPLPFFIGPTHAQAGEREIPLYYAGDQGTFTQVNAVMPFDVTVNTLQQVAVWRGTRRSSYVDVPIATAQPAVFIIVDGERPGVLADAANPIARGKVIVIYGEGLGLVDAGLLAGQESPGNPLASARNPVTVRIGGVNAAVQFAGLTPGLAGLYQINAVVPDAVAPGTALPVVVTSAGLSSEPVTISVR